MHAGVVVLGGVVGARDEGALGPRLGATGVKVDAGAGDVPHGGEHFWTETLAPRGTLKAHNGWVTAIATTPNPNADTENMIVSASRDKTLLVWHLTRQEGNYGYPRKSLCGHSHFVQDVVVSSDGNYALSGSWDGTMRLWDLNGKHPTRQFVGHTKDVLSVAFSVDNRQIISGSRDKTIKLWNTIGQVKYTIASSAASEEGHSEWVSCVRFSPSLQNTLIVSCGWDKLVKVWNLSTCKLRTNLVGHSGYLTCVTISPDGSLCASGGKDHTAMLWDLQEGKHLYSLDAGDTINALCFSPNRYWLCAATSLAIKIWDLESKLIVAELTPDDLPPPSASKKTLPVSCLSLCWSHDGNTLFSGYTDGAIRVWAVTMAGSR